MTLPKHFFLVLSLFFCVVSCGGGQPARSPATPPAASPKSSAPGEASQVPSKDAGAQPREGEVRAFLAARSGETPAASTPLPGIGEMSAKEAMTAEKCEAARKKALEQTEKLSPAKQLDAAMSAMTKIDKKCFELLMQRESQESTKRKDSSAQEDMKSLARAAAQSMCSDGASNPPPGAMGACVGPSATMLWDREGWSCLAKAIPESARPTSGYVFSFHTDAALRTYEIVGRGCDMTIGAKGFVETELVVRGRLGAPVDDVVVLRRSPSQQR